PAYAAAGATIAEDAAAALADADIVLKVQRPLLGRGAVKGELALIKPGAVLIGLLQPQQNPSEVAAYAKAGIAAFAMELVPRITRAQTMDVLSSQANLAGYKATVEAAAEFGRALPMMMTAAGTIKAARVLVMGAGVAGLQAIATARRLGDRRARRRQGTGREPRRHLRHGRRGGCEDRGDRRRLRPRDERGLPAPAAGEDCRGAAPHRHRHLHRADPRQEGAGPADRGDGGAAGAGLDRRRSRGRGRRQRRGLQAGRGGDHPGPGQDHRPPQFPVAHRGRCEPALRAQPDGVPLPADRQGGAVADRPRRRDRQGNPADDRRRRGQSRACRGAGGPGRKLTEAAWPTSLPLPNAPASWRTRRRRWPTGSTR